MGRLKGHCCYLAGPMECVNDNGVDWRNMLTPKLHDMGVGVFNPCDKPIDYAKEDDNTKRILIEAKQTGDWEKAHALCKEFVGVDARMVHLSSFIILNIDKSIHMCGTYVEYTWAVQQRKPVLVHVKQGKAAAPGFVVGMNPPELIFGNWDDLLQYLYHIDTDKVVKDLKRWTFFDFNKVYGRKTMSLFLVYKLLCGMFTFFIGTIALAYMNYDDKVKGRELEPFHVKIVANVGLMLLNYSVAYIAWFLIPFLLFILVLTIPVFVLAKLFEYCNLKTLKKFVKE